MIARQTNEVRRSAGFTDTKGKEQHGFRADKAFTRQRSDSRPRLHTVLAIGLEGIEASDCCLPDASTSGPRGSFPEENTSDHHLRRTIGALTGKGYDRDPFACAASRGYLKSSGSRDTAYFSPRDGILFISIRPLTWHRTGRALLGEDKSKKRHGRAESSHERAT